MYQRLNHFYLQWKEKQNYNANKSFMVYSVNGITPALGLHLEYLENYNEKRHDIGMKGWRKRRELSEIGGED